MGGATPVARERGGRRSLDAAMNLVPFIDLLSCCISFLLITAVWTQLSRMSTTVHGGSEVENASVAPPAARLLVSRDGYTFTSSAGESVAIPKRADRFDDARLDEVLHAERELRPTQTVLEVRGDDGTRYHEIVRAMDLAKSAGYPSVDIDGT
jgi:biopolymer transport protein ExbD